MEIQVTDVIYNIIEKLILQSENERIDQSMVIFIYESE